MSESRAPSNRNAWATSSEIGIERTIAWLNRCRRLAKDRENLVVTPVAEEGRNNLSIDLYGHLAGILSMATKAKRPLHESGPEVGYTKLVAGVGFEPTTFRL